MRDTRYSSIPTYDESLESNKEVCHNDPLQGEQSEIAAPPAAPPPPPPPPPPPQPASAPTPSQLPSTPSRPAETSRPAQNVPTPVAAPQGNNRSVTRMDEQFFWIDCGVFILAIAVFGTSILSHWILPIQVGSAMAIFFLSINFVTNRSFTKFVSDRYEDALAFSGYLLLCVSVISLFLFMEEHPHECKNQPPANVKNVTNVTSSANISSLSI